MPDIFISYSRKDTDFVRELDRELVAHQLDVWVDYEDIPPTATWRGEISDAISASDIVVFVLSPASLTSREVGVELDAALEQNKRVIPLLRAEPNGATVPDWIAAINWIRATPEDDLGGVVNTLLQAARTDLTWVRTHTRLLVRAREWEAKGHDRAYLLSGQDLRDAEAALSQSGGKEPEPVDLQRAYVAAGRAAAERRQRAVLAGVSSALIVAIVLAVVAFIQRSTAISERKQAQSRQLAAAAALNEQSDPQLSLLLAIQAARVSPTREAASSLREALVRSALRATLKPTTSALSAALSPDGRYALTFGRQVRVWNVQTMHAPISFSAIGAGRAAQFTPDGRRALITEPSGAVGVWDLARAARVGFLSGRAGTPNAIAISADGRFAAVAATRGAFVEEIGTGKAVAMQLSRPTDMKSVAFAPDGRTIAGASASGVELWRTADGSRADHLVLTNPVPEVRFVAGGRELALSESSNSSLWLWDLRARRLIRQWSTPSAISSDGARVAVVTTDRRHIELIELATNRTVTITDPSQTSQVHFAPDGQMIVSGDDDLSYRVYKTADGSLAATLLAPAGGGPTDAEFSRDSERLITTNADGTVRVWQLFTPGQLIFPGASAAADASGSTLMLQRPTGVQVRRGGQSVALPGSNLLGGSAQIDRGGRVVVGISGSGSGGAAELWHVGSGGPVTLIPASQMPTAIGVSSDGRTVATVTQNGSVTLWNSATGQVLRPLGNTGALNRSVSFSRDGHWLVTGLGPPGSAVRVWPTGGGRPVAFPGGWPSLSPAASRLLIVSTPHSWLYRTTGGKPLAVMSTPEGDLGEFSPDGRLIVTVGQDGYARVWTSDGRPIVQLQHNDIVDSASFSPNSEYVITTSNDGFARVWESVTGQLLLTEPANLNGSTATFTPDSRTFLVDANEGITRYDCDVCQPLPALMKLAATRVTRPLSQAERVRYLGSLPTP